MFYVICKISVDGFHKWDGAPERLLFLRNMHRHLFNIEVRIPVEHSDRDVEIIETEWNVKNCLYERYGKPCQFGNMSCEDIAKIVSELVDAESVCVFEDCGGGAEYRRTK